MVVKQELDLGYIALFLGLRVNELVVDRMRKEGFADVRESHGYVIQHLIEQDRSITELASRMEVTQQAASKVVAELAKLGVVDVHGAEDRRAKRIGLSARGWRAVRRARKVRAGIEARLIRVIGQARCDHAKDILLDCMNELGGIQRIRSRRIRPPG